MTTYDVGDGDDLDLEPVELEKATYLLKEVLRKKTVTFFFDSKTGADEKASAILRSLGIEHKLFPGVGMITAQWVALGVLEEFFELEETSVTEPEDYSCSEAGEDE